jgi:hypothetical protein
VVFRPLVSLLQRRVDARRHRVHVLLRDDALLRPAPRVLLAHARLLLDPRGHQRLRVRGLVLLVVAVAAVADEVDHHVGAEAAAEAIASRTAESAASGSSALTWMIGRSKPFARSLE